MLLLISLMLQFGLYLHAAQIAEAAAQEAVDAAQGQRDDGARGRAAATRLLTDLAALEAPAVRVDRGAATVTATVTGHAPRLLPGLDLRVAAIAEGPVERFVAEPAP